MRAQNNKSVIILGQQPIDLHSNTAISLSPQNREFTPNEIPEATYSTVIIQPHIGSSYRIDEDFSIIREKQESDNYVTPIGFLEQLKIIRERTKATNIIIIGASATEFTEHLGTLKSQDLGQNLGFGAEVKIFALDAANKNDYLRCLKAIQKNRWEVNEEFIRELSVGMPVVTQSCTIKSGQEISEVQIGCLYDLARNAPLYREMRNCKSEEEWLKHLEDKGYSASEKSGLHSLYQSLAQFEGSFSLHALQSYRLSSPSLIHSRDSDIKWLSEYAKDMGVEDVINGFVTRLELPDQFIAGVIEMINSEASPAIINPKKQGPTITMVEEEEEEAPSLPTTAPATIKAATTEESQINKLQKAIDKKFSSKGIIVSSYNGRNGELMPMLNIPKASFENKDVQNTLKKFSNINSYSPETRELKLNKTFNETIKLIERPQSLAASIFSGFNRNE